MSDSCRTVRDLLVEDTVRKLSAAERDLLARHLEDCAQCRKLSLAHQEDDRRLSAFVVGTDGVMSRLEKAIMERIATRERAATRPARSWLRFIGSSRLRWTAAAALAVCIVLGVNLIDRDSSGGLVWAEVLARVEQAESYICRRIEKKTGEAALEMVEYRSAEFGLRQDIYQGGKLQAVQYIVPAEKMLYAIVHRDRTYMQQRLSDEQIAEIRRQSNAQEIVKSFREQEYRSLGRRRIEGKMAEGIEINDPEDWVAIFESGRLQLWVDVQTEWPVRLQLEGTARGGRVRKTYTLKDFQWNPALSASDFAVEIPDGYELIADLDQVQANEEQTIDGLRDYATLLGGRYPSALSFATAIAEAEKQLDAKHDRYDDAAGRDLTALFRIRSACFFYRDLLAADKDVAYYGGKVHAMDFDRVLLRWRLDDGQYRVIYGDLRAETVSRERLAELERNE